MYRSVYMGDYRVRHAGDFLGIGGAIGKVAKVVGKVAGAAAPFLPGPLGGAARIAGKVLSGKGGAAYGAGAAAGGLAMAAAAGGGLPVLRIGGSQVNVKNILPGGQPFIGEICRSGRYNQDGSCRKRPTMNPANPRALRRAMRRQQGFIKLARRALRGTGLTIGRRGQARKGPPRRR